MQVDIWSDILCPFCYIGKRHFEAALRQFPSAGAVQVRWHSFELNPDAPREYDGDIYDMLSERYGVSRQQAQAMNNRVEEMARLAGLDFQLDRAQPTNSFDAHRLIHLADRHGRQDAAEERLFAAYFTGGKHIGHPETLQEIGLELGLPAAEIDLLLASDAFAAEVRADEEQARQLGIRGVPFFVVDGRYAVSGAQPVEMFVQALERAAGEAGTQAAS